MQRPGSAVLHILQHLSQTHKPHFCTFLTLNPQRKHCLSRLHPSSFLNIFTLTPPRYAFLPLYISCNAAMQSVCIHRRASACPSSLCFSLCSKTHALRRLALNTHNFSDIFFLCHRDNSYLPRLPPLRVIPMFQLSPNFRPDGAE